MVEYNFVELNRTFHELSEDTDAGENSYIRRFLTREKPLQWADLIKEFRVVVLSEAGTGKTAAIWHLAGKLRAEGKPAFFLRLEHISNDFEDAFEVGTFQEFENWLASGDEGWLLLDSVDEARLRNPGDFEHAIRKFGRRIGVGQQRAHIVISGRTSAWRARADLSHCTAHLPYQPATVQIVEGNDTDDDYTSLQLHTKSQREPSEHSAFRIVALDDLDADQIKAFAVAKGVKDVQKFLEAVERADAWSFTARPQDLEELTEFWNDHGHIGGRLEIMRNSIGRRISERDPNRAEARPLSPERALRGVRIVAATATLTREQTIQVPDATDSSKGIAISEVLHDWDDRERATLLSLPIFDEAIYGAVRFHHRSVREFLTAEWLAELLTAHTSRRKVECLLFQVQYGIEVIVPTMRPILPWLAILDGNICEHLCKLAPEVLLEGGDPNKLPLATRRMILHQVCKQIAAGASGAYTLDYSAVQRFANEDLTIDVKTLLSEYSTNDDVVWLLLRMVWQGELKSALLEAKEFALSSDSSHHTRIAAFRAVRAVGSISDMEEVRERFLNESAELNREWLSELLDELEPTTSTVRWLLDCIAKTIAENPHSVDELREAVGAFVQRADVEVLPEIAAGLNSLLDMAPVIEHRYCEISQRFGWLIRGAAIAVERLIEARHPVSTDRDVLGILHKFSMSRYSDIDDYKQTGFEFSEVDPIVWAPNRVEQGSGAGGPQDPS